MQCKSIIWNSHVHTLNIRWKTVTSKILKPYFNLLSIWIHFNLHCKEIPRQNNHKLSFRKTLKNNEITFNLIAKSYLHTKCVYNICHLMPATLLLMPNSREHMIKALTKEAQWCWWGAQNRTACGRTWRILQYMSGRNLRSNWEYSLAKSVDKILIIHWRLVNGMSEDAGHCKLQWAPTTPSNTIRNVCCCK